MSFLWAPEFGTWSGAANTRRRADKPAVPHAKGFRGQ